MSSATTVTNEFCCSEMQFHLLAGELGLVYYRRFREFGILYRDGGSSKQSIYYCPWCGSQLPTSLRKKWFEMIESQGLEPDSPEIPQEFLTDEWWKQRGL